MLLLCTLKQIAPKSNLFLKSCWLVKLWIWKFLNKNRTRKNCFRYLKHMSPLNAAICTTISYTLWVEWYYLKNKYLTLRSKVKVPQRSLWYATHRLVVMHPHTKYHWPISKDKNVMARTRKYYLNFLFDLEVKGQGLMKVIMVFDTPLYGHAPTYLNDNI